MKCVNCGRETKNPVNTRLLGFMICKSCDNARRQMTKLFERGVEFQYNDGTKETIKLKNERTN